jgi:hypothetical protein
MLNSVNLLLNDRQVPSPPGYLLNPPVKSLHTSSQFAGPNLTQDALACSLQVSSSVTSPMQYTHTILRGCCGNSSWPMLCFHCGRCTCRTTAAIDDPDVTKKMTLRWRKFVVSTSSQKKGEGKKEKKKKLLWRNYPNRARRSESIEEIFWEEFRNSGILTFASHRHYLELMVLGIHWCSRSLFRLVFR